MISPTEGAYRFVALPLPVTAPRERSRPRFVAVGFFEATGVIYYPGPPREHGLSSPARLRLIWLQVTSERVFSRVFFGLSMLCSGSACVPATCVERKS